MSTRLENGRRHHDRGDEGRRSTAAPILALSGLILAIGTMLPWASQSGQSGGAIGSFNESISGSSFSDGRIVMGLGVALLAIAVVMLTTRRRGAWFDADLLGLALATTALVVTIATWAGLNPSAGAVSRSADIGLYVSLAGSLLGVIGSLAGLTRSESDRAEGRRQDVVGSRDRAA